MSEPSPTVVNTSQEEEPTLAADSRGLGYSAIETTNERFEFYLRELLGGDETELACCLDTMRQPLPATFRVLKADDEFRKQLHSLEAIGVSATPVPFCPHAWQLNTGRKQMRKSEEMAAFHNWLVDACESGQVVRQEAVSMIPPLCLQAQPGDRVLDMCAAPGSKTSQLVEACGVDNARSVVVANDADRNRAYMLYHQVRRLCSPALVVTQYDATRIPKALGAFDRVLCDVPCSGDGTVRKNNLLWRDWNPKNALGLHALQRRILQKGVEMLRAGTTSRLVYSTCSLNPVENEAVVASILRDNPDLQLLDPRSLLPGLKACPGMTTWRVISPDATVFYDRYDDVPDKQREKIKPSMFPAAEVEASLERCLRIYPHLQDSGGFFIALLARRNDSPSELESQAVVVPPHAKKTKVSADNILVPIPEPLRNELVGKFFTTPPRGSFVSRSASHKGVQFVNEAVAELLPLVGPQGMLVNAGVSAFEHYSGYVEPGVPVYRLIGECLKPLGESIQPAVIVDIANREWLNALLETEGSVDAPESGTLPPGCLVLRHGPVLIPVWSGGNGTRIKAFVPKLERPLLRNALAHSKLA